MTPPKSGKRKRGLIRPKPVARNCVFCKEKRNPNYKNYQELRQFVSDRARILGKDRTGVCAKHQRLIAREIKRARMLGLI